MGLSGLEPPTLRLSVVRSSQLSYKPLFRVPTKSQTSVAFVILKGGATQRYAVFAIRRKRSERSLTRRGGDSRDRTGDLLLARQALSQLSYIPFYLLFRQGEYPLN